MSIIDNSDVRNRLFEAFPKGFINRNLEFIAHPGRNSYFLLDGVESEIELQSKILEWLSREAVKGGSRQSQKYHLDGINKFLGTSFTSEQMETIYTYLGNRVNHERTFRFLLGGHDVNALEQEADHE